MSNTHSVTDDEAVLQAKAGKDRAEKRTEVPDVTPSLDGGEDGKEKGGTGIYRLDGGEDGDGLGLTHEPETSR